MVKTPTSASAAGLDDPLLEVDRPLSEIKADLFKALAHPARVRALEVLVEHEYSVGELQPLVGIESSHLSQQLAVLRRAGLVVTRREGTSIIYAVRDDHVQVLLQAAKDLLRANLTHTRSHLDDLVTRLQ